MTRWRDALARAGWNPYRIEPADIAHHMFSDVGETIAVPAVAGPVRDAISAARGDADLAGALEPLCGAAHLAFLTKGRAAEIALVDALGLAKPVVVTPGLFATTRRALARCGATIETLPLVPDTSELDLDSLRARLARGDVAIVYLEPANNALSARPLGIANVAAVRALCDAHHVRLLLDAPRLLTNAALCGERDLPAAARRMLELAHAFTIPCGKELLAPYGAIVGSTDASVIGKVAVESFQTGTSLGTLEPLALRVAIAAGFRYVWTHPELVIERGRQITSVREQLALRGIVVDGPPGSHAVFIPLPNEARPAAGVEAMIALVGQLYSVSGILAQLATDPSGTPLLRLALPLAHTIDPSAVADGVVELVRTTALTPRLVALPGQDATHPYFRAFAPV
jgi:tryptophanase